MTGKVQVKQGVEVAKYAKNAVVFTDGSKLEADAVIFAYVFSSFILILQPAYRDSQDWVSKDSRVDEESIWR